MIRISNRKRIQIEFSSERTHSTPTSSILRMHYEFQNSHYIRLKELELRYKTEKMQFDAKKFPLKVQNERLFIHLDFAIQRLSEVPNLEITHIYLVKSQSEISQL